MEVDWITVVAQIVNFLVLVWILRWLLYGPITRAMEARETRITSRFAEADDREAKAKEQSARLSEERADLAAREEAVLEAARHSARDIRQALEAEARKDVEHAHEAWQAQMKRDQSAFLADLREVAADNAENVARRALADLASADLEDAIVQTFITKLETLDAEMRAMLRAGPKDAGALVIVESAFSLSSSMRDQLMEAIRTAVQTETAIQFSREDALVAGIRLRVGGQTVHWSIDAFLDDLEDETRRYFESFDPGPESGQDQRAAE